MANHPKQKKLKFHIDPQKEGGDYSNIVTIIHSETEFLIDFGMFLPGRDAIRVANRTILSPRSAKQLLIMLKQNIEKYESNFGNIQLPTKQRPPFPHSTPDLAQ